MALTQPQDDWSETRAEERHRAAGSEWDALRGELATLIDQVESRLLSHADAPQPHPEHKPASRPAHPERSEAADRHEQALRSVRHAINRYSDRHEDHAQPARSEEIAEAIGQIRARQGIRPALTRSDARPVGERFRQASSAASPAQAPASADPAALLDLRRTLLDMNARIESFEARFSAQIADLGSNREVAGQVAQLAEVVELLAGAIGESGNMRRIEGQIAELAEAVAHAPASEDSAILARLDALSRTLEGLSDSQAVMAERHHAESTRTDETLRLVEDGIRSIYERIDAIDGARVAAPQELERLSTELSALARALDSRETQARETLAEHFSALETRIDALGLPERNSADALKDSIGSLRAAVLDSLAPRFATIEDKLDTLAARDAAPAVDTSGIEAQLRHISSRIEQTNSQIEDLLAQSRVPAASAGTDLDALEARLSRLFTETRPAPDTMPLTRLGDTIASVDTRLARLEATLDARTAQGPILRRPPVDDSMAIGAAPAPGTGLRDLMPQNPDSDAPLPSRPGAVRTPIPDPEALAREARAATSPLAPAGQGFHLDPERIARPEKPVSSFAEDAAGESGFAPAASEPEAPALHAEDLHSAVSRASFIEAARRAARNHAETVEPEDAPRSLIGRAFARFQSNEAAADPAPAPVAEAPQAGKRKRRDVEAERIEPDVPFPSEAVETEAAATGRESVLRRHRRVLLLGAALAVALLLTANLVSQRLLSGPDAAGAQPEAAVSEPAQPAQEAPAEDEIVLDSPAPAVEALPEDAPGLETPAAAPEAAPRDPLTDPVALGSQPAAFAAGGLDTAATLDSPAIDAISTAALGDQPIRAITLSGAGDPAPQPMPVAQIPDGIGPQELREAAMGGDMFAQFEIAAILTEGQVVEQDLTQAAAWYERAAAQGFAPAQYRLGNLYESGQGVVADLDQARLWYQRAAELGNRMSMHNLASLYAGGQLDSQDFAAAAHWFEEAASRGLTDSQFNLGMLYARGLGVEQSFSTSYFWFSLAAAAGDADAAQARDDMVRSLDAETLQALDAEIAAWAPTSIDMAANFAPIGTWADEFDAGTAIANRDVVLRVQQVLAKLGYDVGTPDGLSGPLTRQAISSFERATGMSETGEINPRLLAVLGSQPV